jgi:hypothetical protein
MEWRSNVSCDILLNQKQSKTIKNNQKQKLKTKLKTNIKTIMQIHYITNINTKP